MKHKHYKWRYITAAIFAVLIILLIIARIYLNSWVLNYVNKTLDNIPGYKGSVKNIDIALYRGAYKIHNLKINKVANGIPVPFVDIDLVDLSIEWKALIHGKIVSNIALEKPVINFAVNKSSKQTGAGVDWTKPIKELMPVDINQVTFNNGKLTYQDFSSTPKVNLYIHNMTGEVQNLRNVVDKNQPLPSTLSIKGSSIGEGNLNIQGRMNILKEVPDMELQTKLEKVNLPALNDYFKAYALIDIEKGNLSVYSELNVKNKNVSGYIKPIATDISIINLKDAGNPIKLAWETVVSTVVTVFTNQSKGQFATKIPLSGNLDNISTSTWPAIAGIVRNAFVQAFNKGLDRDEKPGKE